MMNEREALLERIRKLLAMAADSSSPNEAAIAAGRARKLMDKHQIAMHDLKKSDGFLVKNVDKAYRFIPVWKNCLVVQIAKFNDCKAGLSHEYKTVNKSYARRLTIMGFESDVIVACQMYDYLTGAVDRFCSEYLKGLGFTKYYAKMGDAFKKSASDVLRSRLAELQEEREKSLYMSNGTSLVLYKMAAVEERYGEARYGTAKIKSRRDMATLAASAAGSKAGREISLNQQIGKQP